MLAYGTAWKTTHIKGAVVAQPTIRKVRVQWTIGDKLLTSEHGAAFFKDQQPIILVIPPPPLPNVATPQDARPALSEQDNEDFGRERDVEELQNDDEKWKTARCANLARCQPFGATWAEVRGARCWNSSLSACCSRTGHE